MERQLVVVSGAPGAGKSSLAAPLAAALGFALVSKDRIKEKLHDGLAGPAEPDLAWSRQLGAASMELLWAMAADAPAVVVEANFRPHDEYQHARLSALASGRAAVEAYCACPPEVAVRRYNERGPTTHPVHVIRSLPLSAMAEYDRPLGIGSLVTVDTTLPLDPVSVAAAVLRRLGDPALSPAAGNHERARHRAVRVFPRPFRRRNKFRQTKRPRE